MGELFVYQQSVFVLEIEAPQTEAHYNKYFRSSIILKLARLSLNSLEKNH